jgi:hypothetical protein
MGTAAVVGLAWISTHRLPLGIQNKHPHGSESGGSASDLCFRYLVRVHVVRLNRALVPLTPVQLVLEEGDGVGITDASVEREVEII